MRLSFRLAAVKDRSKKKKKKIGGRRSIIKAAATCREIPEDILVEILVRLPADSLMRFKCVSRRWSSLICSRYFTNLFFEFSSSRRLVCMNVMERGCCREFNSYMLISSSLSNLDTSSSGLVSCYNLDATTSFLQLNRLTLPGVAYFFFANVLRGLMCFRVGKEIRIINLTTRQVLSLPPVESSLLLECQHAGVWNYFGYDPINDEYKVLSTVSVDNTDNKWRSETQVLVLGAEASWRNTKSHTSPPPPHCPQNEFSVNINGVLYNVAWSDDDINVLMSFDFNSEEFNLIEFPVEACMNSNENKEMHNLMNYQGQVALFDYSRLQTECILDLWVLEDVMKSKWSHKVFVLPCDQFRLSLDFDVLLDADEFKITSTGRSGEVTLSASFPSRNAKSTYVIYDLERNFIAKEVVIEPQNNHRPGRLETNVWDYVENIMYLET